MTKKDYILIAKSIAQGIFRSVEITKVNPTESDKMARTIIDYLAYNLQVENENFDSKKFTDYIYMAIAQMQASYRSL